MVHIRLAPWIHMGHQVGYTVALQDALPCRNRTLMGGLHRIGEDGTERNTQYVRERDVRSTCFGLR